MAETICQRLAQGESLRRICSDDDMPHRDTVIRWLREKPEFFDQHAAARATQQEALLDAVPDILMEATPETANLARVQSDGLFKLAALMAPKRYGTKRLEHSGAEGGPMVIKWLSGDEE